jgi:hypothetical protein
MQSEKKYRNAFNLGDWFYSPSKHEEEMAKINALNTISQKSTTTSMLVYAIPLVGLIIMGVLVAVALKKKKV